MGTKPKQRDTLRALGLRKINATREHADNAVIRGMIDKVKHLVEVTEKK
ncbi:MAG TPA: 50S ribosomal protein L30 [Spirochaetota bacterium]|nr:50S ribosomal protein L30 [Spirochaetota bacterium]